MANDLQQIADLLLKNRPGPEDWGEMSHLDRSECSKKVANKFLICCLLDFRQHADVAWKKGDYLVEELGKRGDPEDVWVTISSFSKDKWKSKYKEHGSPHPFHWAYERLWDIANKICAQYAGDARNIWSGKSPSEALCCLQALGAGDQISRMIVGALRDCQQIEGKSSNVKADRHLCRVLGRVVYGEKIGALKATELTQKLNPADPWQLDWALWKIGKAHCRPTSPNCAGCYLSPHCIYYRHLMGSV
jgi:hypothetical protein